MRVHLAIVAVLSLGPAALAQQYPFIPVPNSPRYPLVLFIDHSQRLWVGSDSGLSYYDGSRFLSLQGLGFPKSAVSAIDEDDEGGVWTASLTGVHRFFHSQIEQALNAVATSVGFVARGTVVAAANPPEAGTPDSTRLYRIQQEGGRWRPQLLPVPTSRGSLSRDSKGALIYSCGEQVWCEIAGSAIARWQPGSPLPVARHPYRGDFGDVPVKRVLRDRFGCVWLRSERITAYQCPGDREPVRLPLSIAEANFLTHMCETSDGSLLLASTGILALGRPGSFRIATLANGLPIAQDAVMASDGTIWIAGEQGLFRFLYPFRMEYWTERDGIGDPWFALRVRNHIYAAGGKGVLVLSDDRSRWMPLPGTAELGRAYHLLPGPDHTLFVALAYHSVVQIRTDGSVVRHPPPGLKRLNRLAQTPDGRIWGVGNGVERVLLHERQLDAVEENLPGPHTVGEDIQVDRAGSLWACYTGGLIRLRADGWHAITRADGLLQNECRSFVVHPNGDIWYAYNSIPGFSRIRLTPQAPPQIRHFRSPEIQGAQINVLDVDGRGWLWRGADGIYVADSAQADAGWWLHLEADGSPDVNLNQQSFYSDSDGSVWFAAGTTLKHFYPPVDLLHPSRAPDIFISSISWGGGPSRIADTVSELPHRSDIAVQVGSLQSDRRNVLQVRYRLLPGDSSWRESSGLDLHLGPVAWGAHVLEVQGRIGQGPWSPSVRRALSVGPPVWLSWQSLTALTGIMLFGLVRVRTWMERRARARKPLPDLTLWRETAYYPEAHELVGSLLDSRYQIGRAVARGGFATVLQGIDLKQGHRCAVKVFRRELLDAGVFPDKFGQEISALETVRHPNIVRIYGHGTTPDGAPYLVMEFIDGQTLRQIVDAGPVPATRTASLLRQAGSALDAIHRKGIYHRDLKPENVMIRADSQPDEDLVLIDFSIAIVKDPDQSLQGLSRAAGTFGYMTPEHSIGYADASTDVYNLAKLVIEMLTGRRLSSLLASASLDLSERVRALLSTLPVTLSSRSIDLFATALEFHPSHRLHNALEFADAIAADLESMPQNYPN